MSTKFNSAQNGEKEVFTSDTETKTAAANAAAPADDGRDSELNIQDLLKKYLPDYADETPAEEKAESAEDTAETESADAEQTEAEIVFEEIGVSDDESAAEPVEEIPAQENALYAKEAPEEEAVPQKKFGGLFARFRRRAAETEESAAPDSEIFAELSEENGDDTADGVFAAATEVFHLSSEDAGEEDAAETADVQPVEVTEDAEDADAAEGAEAAEEAETVETESDADDAGTPDENEIDLSTMDEKDISLWVALGMEDQLEKKMGAGVADKVADRLEDERKEHDRQQKLALEYEYTDREQIPQIAEAYKFALGSLKIKMIAAAILTVILFFYENITLFGVQFAGALDPAVYPVVHIMVSLQILLIVCAIAYEQIFAGFTNLFTMRPTPESVLSVLTVFSVAYSVFLAVIAEAGAEPVLYNFPVAVVALMSLIFTYFNTKREAFSFNIVSSKRQKFVFNRIPATDACEESKIFGATDEDSPDVLRIARADFVDGYFARTSTILHTTRVYVGAMLSCVAAAAVLMAVFAFIGGADSNDAITVAYLTLIGVIPVSMFFTYSYPFYKANREAYEYDSTIVGEPSLDEYSGAAIVSFDDKNVFPSYGVKVQNIKIYNKNRIDRVLYYASSAFASAGGPLSDVFALATMEMERSEEVEILSAGVGYLETSVDGKQILFGRSDILTELGYDIPVEVVEEDSYVQGDLSILYMLRDGDLIAKMYIRYVMDADFEFILRQFTKGGTCVCVKTLDPNIDEEMIFSKVRGKQYPLRIVRNMEGSEAVEHADSGIVSRGTTKSLLQVLSYCDMVLSVKSTNTVVSIVSAVVSLAILVIVMMSKNVGALQSWMVAVNQLFWMIPAMLTTKLFIK